MNVLFSLYKYCIVVFMRHNVLFCMAVRYLSVAGNGCAGNNKRNNKQSVKVNFRL